MENSFIKRKSETLEFLLNPKNVPEDIIETFRKKLKKKKLKPAYMKKLLARVNEEIKQRTIKQKQEYLKDTKVRVQREWEINRDRVEKYEAERLWRQSELEKSNKVLSEINTHWAKTKTQKRKQKEWEQYLSGSRLPNPGSITEMNTYIFQWMEYENNDTMAYCLEKTDEVMKCETYDRSHRLLLNPLCWFPPKQLLDGLEEVINDPPPESSLNYIEDLKELRHELRSLLQKNIDAATFRLFSRIETDMVSMNVTTSKYTAKGNHFRMSLWAELITPIPSSRLKEVRHPLKVVFEETDVIIIVPVNLLDIHKVMRSAWLYYDHWSDTSRTYKCHPLPKFYSKSVYELFMEENETKIELMNYRKTLENIKKHMISTLPPDPSLSQELLTWDSEPQRALSEEVAFKEWEEEDNLGKLTKSILNENEVNLRERTILGDLLLIEILHQPPQPKFLRYKHSVLLSETQVLPELMRVDYYYKLNQPETEDEEGEDAAETKREKIRRIAMSRNDLLEGKKKLVSIELKRCETVTWFEDPKVALWDANRKYWSNEDIYETNYEDDGTITFNCGRLGLFGFHVTRYKNMPYEDWLFESDNDNGVNFYLKTSMVELNFIIRKNKVCLEQIRNAPNKVIWSSIVGNFYTPDDLAKYLKKKGLDIFPQPDAGTYVDTIKSKHYVVEKTIYQIWGLFSQSFRFKRSKFNQSAGRSNILFLAQEVNPNHQCDYSLIQNSMCSSYVLKMKEDTSTSYNPEPMSGTAKYVDLYGLLYKNSTINCKKKLRKTSQSLIQTVKEFLHMVRPLSFS
ncbi:conserved hypothetical protein [Pediculus humanus corporis]|uniref:Uncharacterized protein n=1 Tax=Pediculus humanus subsp. corporis TaxID=121224 RepID=E0W1V7_PEDHC|nr:uncharacterized protein Phum_PHUM580000 [Pediculus humanus corporis]EEB19551.1 conserved hypothetical protein [Pediculus humanus corporis]